ncbi:MAG: CDP-alcohol phosphatidyltransferase family protein [Saprospiraceae bacterium]|nr:CDP-alcohol phosphatidyltransferase family protein [Saprospiraceae bacterium]
MGKELNHKLEYSTGRKLAAWAVHLFTASGIVAGFFAIVAIAEANFFLAFILLLVTTIIDGIDGTFARMVKTTEVLPNISGKTMDYVIDFATYAIIPAYLIYAATQGGISVTDGGEYLIPDYLREVTAVIILLISAIYYGKEGMVSEDYYFVGFPVLWNLVAFYLYYVFNLPPIWNFILVLVFGILHFVPIKFMYPSRTQKFQVLNIIVTILCIGSNFALLVVIEWDFSGVYLEIIARVVSILTLAYFGFLGIYHTYFDKETKGIA